MRLLLAVLAFAGLAVSAASAQTADTTVASGPPASSARPAWLSLNLLSTAEIDSGEQVQEGLFGTALEYRRAVGAGPLFVQGGLSAHGDLFSSTALAEGHVTAGAGTSVGPVHISISAGPSLARIKRRGFTDPDFVGDETRIALGLYAGAQALVVVFPRSASASRRSGTSTRGCRSSGRGSRSPSGTCPAH